MRCRVILGPDAISRLVRDLDEAAPACPEPLACQRRTGLSMPAGCRCVSAGLAEQIGAGPAFQLASKQTVGDQPSGHVLFALTTDR